MAEDEGSALQTGDMSTFGVAMPISEEEEPQTEVEESVEEQQAESHEPEPKEAAEPETQEPQEPEEELSPEQLILQTVYEMEQEQAKPEPEETEVTRLKQELAELRKAVEAREEKADAKLTGKEEKVEDDEPPNFADPRLGEVIKRVIEEEPQNLPVVLAKIAEAQDDYNYRKRVKPLEDKLSALEEGSSKVSKEAELNRNVVTGLQQAAASGDKLEKLVVLDYLQKEKQVQMGQRAINDSHLARTFSANPHLRESPTEIARAVMGVSRILQLAANAAKGAPAGGSPVTETSGVTSGSRNRGAKLGEKKKPEPTEEERILQSMKDIKSPSENIPFLAGR